MNLHTDHDDDDDDYYYYYYLFIYWRIYALKGLMDRKIREYICKFS